MTFGSSEVLPANDSVRPDPSLDPSLTVSHAKRVVTTFTVPSEHTLEVELPPRSPQRSSNGPDGSPPSQISAPPVFTHQMETCTTRNAYQYVGPLTSPFYRHVLSPTCDWLCHKVVPKSVTPDQLSYISLSCAVFATVSSHSQRPALAGILWLLYSFLDNIDGKQARRLNMSTAGGEFLDHSCDSIATSLSAILWMNALIPDRIRPSTSHFNILGTSTPTAPYTGLFPLFATLSGQFPFFLSCCASHVIGRVLLGGAYIGSPQDYFTVDEYNTLFLPGVCMLRQFAPWIFDFTVIDVHWDAIAGTFTVGVLIALFMFCIALVCCSMVSFQLLTMAKKEHLPLFPTGFVYLVLVWLLRPSFLLCIGPFACLCMEILLGKLRIETRGVLIRIWWPIGWILLVAVQFGTVTAYPFLVLQYLICVCLLLWYKLKVHQAASVRRHRNMVVSRPPVGRCVG